MRIPRDNRLDIRVPNVRLGGGKPIFNKLFVRKFVRTKSYEVRKKVRKCDSPNFLTKFVKIRCESGRERNKPISRNYTTHAAANGKAFYTEREKAQKFCL